MANYNYTRGYTVAELEALLVQVKAEREKYLQSASDSGSSYSRIAASEIEKKFNGIMDALELLAPEKYQKTNRRMAYSEGLYNEFPPKNRQFVLWDWARL